MGNVVIFSMTDLHLIIHKSMIEDSLKEGGEEHSTDQLKSVLKYIECVEKSEKNVRHILFGKDNYPWPGSLNQLLGLCNGYSRIILYGTSKNCCVKWAKKDLEMAGIEAVIDEAGVI